MHSANNVVKILRDNSPNGIMQECVTLFEMERMAGRAYIDSNRAPRFLRRKAYSKYYQLSEHLREVSYDDFKKMLKFMSDTWYAEDQKI